MAERRSLSSKKEGKDMNRSKRVAIARETVAIVQGGGRYVAADGRTVDIADAVRRCCESTRYYTPQEIARLHEIVSVRPAEFAETRFEVVNETTLAGIARVVADGGRPAALNFASAKNPGGGFLGGSQAQEESLARSSALYASLMTAWTFYERHRDGSSMLYSDAMIVSPDCPIIRDDDGRLLGEPHLATFITSPAPNAGAAEQNRPDEVPQIPEVLRRRAELVLAAAAAAGAVDLVLGAWGCGVFRNDPTLVAEVFAGHLRRGAWLGRFRRVVFSVLDRSAEPATFKAFRDTLG
jgi:uncharacterized protein (TIGR02452 family)